MEHVTPQMIRQFLLSAGMSKASALPFHEWMVPLGTHLLPRCDECLRAVHQAFAQWRGLAPDDPWVAQHAVEFLYRRGIPTEVLAEQARRDADELLELSPSLRRERLASEELRFRAPTLVHELLERCTSLLTVDSAGALELGELAVEISWRTDPEMVGNLAFHARARATAHRANTLRLSDERQAAEKTFHQAHEIYAQSTLAEPEIEAEICHLEASLATDQRRFDEAEALLTRARETYSRLGQPRAVARTWINHANLQFHRGNPAAGLPALGAAASILNLDDEPDLHLTIRYSQALYAAEAGDARLAQSFYREHRELLESRPEPWFALRLLWLEAKIARAAGSRTAAAELYGKVRDGFLAEGLGYDAALASLELAVLHLEAGDTEAVQKLAAEMVPIFQAQDVHREALAALVLFERAAHDEELTVAQALALQRYLQLAQRDPSLTFREFRAGGG